LRKKVLIVDDDRTISSLLKTLLELDNFEVLTVARGVDVMPKVSSFQPDAFIIDYHLNDMDGLDLVHELRSQPPYSDAFIVVASGMDKEDEALAAGANHFLLKPYDPDILTALLKQS